MYYVYFNEYLIFASNFDGDRYSKPLDRVTNKFLGIENIKLS